MKKALLLGSSFLLLAHASMQGADAPPTFEWMQVDASNDGLKEAESMGRAAQEKVIYTPIPKVTADASKFTKEYVVDLKKFSISNEGKNPVETANGINAALQDAKATGANRVVFPKGTYLISETVPIILNLQDTIIDLNGSTWQMNTNGLNAYSMVKIVHGAKNMRLTNGTFSGDRYTHDYKTVKGTHEFGVLLVFESGVGLEVDNMLFKDAPGYCISSGASGAGNRTELLSVIYHDLKISGLESGAYSDKGEKIDDPTRTRTGKPYDVVRCNGEFEFGWVEGYMGFPFIKSREYQVVFYDKDMNFLEKRDCIQFKKVAVPATAAFANFEFNQPEVSTKPAHAGAYVSDHCGRITGFRPPTDVHFHNNHIRDNRTLGFAFCGGIRWIMENNIFEGNGGQAPSYGIDFEDGWEMMQSVVFRKNIFFKNHHDLVVCAGTELLFEDNHFESTVVTYGRTFNYTFRKNRMQWGYVIYQTRTGVLSIEENVYRNLKGMALEFEASGIADGFVRLPGKAVNIPPITLKKETLNDVKSVGGTYFKFVDSKLENVQFVAGKDTRLMDLENCDLVNVSLNYEAKGPAVNFLLKNNRGTLREEGPGVSRKQEKGN